MGHKLPGGLYALLDDSLRPDRSMIELAREVIDAGVQVLQLRLETTADRPALELIRQVMAIAGSTKVIVNDRIDLALAAGSHGVHLGADDLPVHVARKILGPDALIGATTRTLTDIEAAREQGADHVGFGPIFSTTTKTVNHALLGLQGLRHVASRSALPIVAIAGISLSTISDVAAAGAWCAAVGSELLKASAVGERARELQVAFSRGAASRAMVAP